MSLKIALVGRPNVGKSTLFNRLAGRRLAIIHDQPGVTRDRRMAQGRLGDLDLELIDTAGFEDVLDQSLEARMRSQTELAIQEADVALFLIDARVGLTPLDQRFGELLRRSGRPVVLAANKCEGKAGAAGLLDAYTLGLGEPIPLSAEHGEGLSELYEALLAAAPGLTAPSADPEAEDVAGRTRPIRLAIVGRPNAGKSTLLNALIGEDRMLTGPEAGITRDAITVEWIWKDRAIKLTDTAGLRKKARIEASLEQLSVGDTLRALRFADVCALVMDSREAFEKQDLQIADLVVREGRALVLVLAKWDVVDDPQARFTELKLLAGETLPQARGAPVVRVAALAGRGLDPLMEAVTHAYDDWNARIRTGDLNNWLRHALERHPPPAVRGRRIKPRYLTQIKARPPTFVLMCSRASELPDSYKRYLVNGIREAFELPAVPIRLHVRQNRNPFAPNED
jgi:GTPase